MKSKKSILIIISVVALLVVGSIFAFAGVQKHRFANKFGGMKQGAFVEKFLDRASVYLNFD